MLILAFLFAFVILGVYWCDKKVERDLRDIYGDEMYYKVFKKK